MKMIYAIIGILLVSILAGCSAPKAPGSDSSGTASDCTCPEGYVKDGEACNPQCYYSEPKCMMPSIECSKGGDTSGDTAGGVGLANPASVYCEENGGTLKIEDEVGGQVGYCYLGQGKVCEEWKYFRKECPAAGCSDTCPVYEAPAPDFCKDGTIAPGAINECGCRGPPRCAREGGCTEELKTCPDGSSVGRVAPYCEFAPCPAGEPVACTMEAKICPDGSSVGRVGPDCEFAPCPGE